MNYSVISRILQMAFCMACGSPPRIVLIYGRIAIPLCRECYDISHRQYLKRCNNEDK